MDVAFYGDFTPTHYAQETSLDETIQDSDDHGSPVRADASHNVALDDVSSTGQRNSFRQEGSGVGTVFRFEHLISASRIALPPPTSSII